MDDYVEGGQRHPSTNGSVALARLSSIDHFTSSMTDPGVEKQKLQEAEVAAFDKQFSENPHDVLTSASFRVKSISAQDALEIQPKKEFRKNGFSSSDKESPGGDERVKIVKPPIVLQPQRPIITKGTYKKLFIGKHDKKTFIARGKFAQVYRCNRKTDLKEVAVKVIDKRRITKKQLQEISQEAAVCRMIETTGCVNVVHLIDYFPERKKNYFVFEMMTGGELFDEIISREDGISENEASVWFKQLLTAIEACHMIGIVHRDLKLENLLLTKDKVLKLGDFGLAALVDDKEDKKMGVVGSPIYVAPEVIKEEPYGKPVDIWGAGIILYMLLSGTMPFQGDTNEETFAAIKIGKFEFPAENFGGVSAMAIEFVKALLVYDPKKRPTASEALENDWLLGKASKLRRKGSVMSMRKKRNSIRPTSQYVDVAE